MILYEAPHHLKKTLADLAETLGGSRKISLCRELTKKHEEAIRTTISEAMARYELEEPRGEYVLVIAGKSWAEQDQETQDDWAKLSIPEHMQHYLSQGMSEKDAMKTVAKDRGVSKREIYAELKK